VIVSHVRFQCAGGDNIARCVICNEPGIAYAQVFQARKKLRSYSLCVSHALILYGFEQLGQDWGRTNLARAFGLREGTLPRMKVSFKP